MLKTSETKIVNNTKDLKAMYFVQINGTEYLSELMTKSFVAGYDSNVDVVLELVKQCLNLKDITEAVVWYNSYNKKLEIVPAKMNSQQLVSFLVQLKIAELEKAPIKKEEPVIQANTKLMASTEKISSNIFFKFINFMKNISQSNN